nr:family 43 glycosylhydrolase [Enterococcus sp. CU9D]
MYTTSKVRMRNMMNHYLFVHFTGEHRDGEQVYFSISQDGKHFHDLNQGKPVLKSTVGEKGIRDPFIIRQPKTGKFYLIATDLRIEKGLGWSAAQTSGSRKIVVWESANLIEWQGPRALTVGVPEAGNVWAPEAIYDEKNGRFLVFWASKVAGKHKMYAAYTDDFSAIDEPFVFMEKEQDVIDSTITFHEGFYYRFTKDETTSRIIMERSPELTGSYEPVFSPVLEMQSGVEGPEIYQGEDTRWYLILDRFAENKGYQILFTDDLGKKDFAILPSDSYDFGGAKKRHGGVMPITASEYKRLQRFYDQQNPVIAGLYADPDLVRFGEDYYIYPTTDGQVDWGSREFSVFKSVSKTPQGPYERVGKVVDFHMGDVPWAKSNAWAPCIAEKDGRYYYYFCGKGEDGSSAIGCAVATNPEGPFVAKKQPLVTKVMMDVAGLTGIHQTIDPSIFEEAGTYYLLWGNGKTGAIARLTSEMTALVPETMQELEGLTDFREAVEVFKKDDRYHFTWSCEDTGNENYHVNYGIAESVTGPVEFLYPILTKCPEKNILGTGHHSILHDDKTGEYWISYHRFATPLEKYPETAKGYNRETCVSPLTFDAKGLIQPVIL